jgi:hypothetical protein
MGVAGRRGCALALGLALAVTPAAVWADGRRHGHGHGHHPSHRSSKFVIGIGPWWGWPGPWWYGPRTHYPYAVYPAPVYAPRIVVEQAPVYIQRDAFPVPQAYWYYCESAGSYYPNVGSCPEPWVKVPPRAE